MNVLWHSTGFSSGLSVFCCCQFYASCCACDYMAYKNKAVVCCLLATSVIMLSEKKKRKRKIWSMKWYLKRNISCDAHLLNELLETDVPWVDAIVMSTGKQRKLWDSLGELLSSLCLKDDWKGQLWGLRYCLSKLRSLISFYVRYNVTQ